MTQYLSYMKKIFLSLLIFALCITAGGQQTEPVNKMTRQDYLQKSKNQKTTGWILLGGGSAMALVGVILASNDNPKESNDLFGSEIYGSNFETGAGLMVAGLAADLISIPFFISSANNARKAASIGFDNQRIFLPEYNNLVAKTQPAIILRIGL